MADLPYVDEHEVDVAAPPDRTWEALTTYVDGVLATGHASVVTRLLGAEPASGFAVASRVPGESVELTGRHRFSRYRLVFTVPSGAAPDRSRLVATTYAAFPGPHGAAYRLLVIRSRLHVLATRRMLEAVRGGGSLAAPHERRCSDFRGPSAVRYPLRRWRVRAA